MVGELANLRLMEAARNGHWYRKVQQEGNSVALLLAFLRHALEAALKGALIDDLKKRATGLAEDALSSGHIEFACALDLRSRGLPIVCRFLNPATRQSYTRRLSYAAALKPFDTVITLGDAVDLKIAVQSRILTTPGITYLRHLRRKRKKKA